LPLLGTIGVRSGPSTNAQHGDSGSETDSLPLSDALDAFERRLISEALAQSAGNVAEAARRLQTDRPNLYRRMRRLGLAGTGE
jgi:transcriptional regulator with GAF, ATPase, and Fis domain